MDIRSFKLLTGEELIGQLVKRGETRYTVKSPLVVHMMRSPEGPSLAFAQWSMVQEQGIEVDLFVHALVGPPVQLLPEVIDSYLQHTTGLLLPPSPKVKSILLS